MTFPPAGGILEHKGGFLMREFFHNMKLSFLLAAVLYIVLGLILLIWPGVSATVFCYAFGGILLIYGVVTIVSFFLRDSRQGSFVFELFLGIVAAALGLLFLLRPVIVASVLPVILGLFIVVDGLVNLKRAPDALSPLDRAPGAFRRIGGIGAGDRLSALPGRGGPGHAHRCGAHL